MYKCLYSLTKKKICICICIYRFLIFIYIFKKKRDYAYCLNLKQIFFSHYYSYFILMQNYLLKKKNIYLYLYLFI